MKTGKKLYKVIHYKKIQYNYIDIQFSPQHVTHFLQCYNKAWIPREKKSFGCCASHAPPPWPLHMIWSDVHIERPLGGQKIWKSPGLSWLVIPWGKHRTHIASFFLDFWCQQHSNPPRKTSLVQLLCNDSVVRTDILSCQVMNCCFLLRILYNSSFFVIWMTFIFWQLDKMCF